MGKKGANLIASKQPGDTNRDEPAWLKVYLDRVIEHRLAHLELWRTEINSLPERIRGMTWLETIRLSGTSIRILPDWLAELPLLKWVDAMGAPLLVAPSNIIVAVDWDFVQQNPGLIGSPKVVGVRLDHSIDRMPEALYEFEHLAVLDLGYTSCLNITLSHTSKLKRRRPEQTIKMTVDATARLRRIERLDLFGCGLRKLPEQICDFQYLEWLSVSENPLRTLPGWLKKIKTLKSLFASSVGLSGIPPWICDLTQLCVLDVSFNNITSIPAFVSDLPCLQTLHAESNALSQPVLFMTRRALLSPGGPDARPSSVAGVCTRARRDCSVSIRVRPTPPPTPPGTLNSRDAHRSPFRS